MLTTLAVKKASPRQKDYKVGDGQGMYLLVLPTGHKSWRLKYRFAGKERRLILGSFPDMSLADARIAREDARRMIREGKDPGLDKQRRKVLSKMPPADTFEEVAREWYTLKLLFALRRDLGGPVQSGAGPSASGELFAIRKGLP